MTISESVKQAISAAFVNNVFKERTQEFITETFNNKVLGSNNIGILPPMPNIKVEKVDDAHDKVTITYDDYNVEGVITWKPSQLRQGHSVFVKFE